MDKIETISGYPPCPECDKRLHLRNMPGYGEKCWYCTGCDTQYDTPSLIQALNGVQELAESLGIVRHIEDEDDW